MTHGLDKLGEKLDREPQGRFRQMAAQSLALAMVRTGQDHPDLEEMELKVMKKEIFQIPKRKRRGEEKRFNK